METQLVRLDAPYNIICSPDGEFALHIATLIVVRENNEGLLSFSNYPVVNVNGEINGLFIGSGKGNADGQVWMHTRLEDCYVIGPQNKKNVPIAELKEVMKYYAKLDMLDMPLRIASTFSWAMTKFGCEFMLFLDNTRTKLITDYDLNLEFEEANGGQSCMVSVDDKTPFYFYEFFDNEPPFSQYVPTNSQAIRYMAELRDTYLRIFHGAGLRSIRFTTKNKNYQWFVDDLNATKTDGE